MVFGVLTISYYWRNGNQVYVLESKGRSSIMAMCHQRHVTLLFLLAGYPLVGESVQVERKVLTCRMWRKGWFKPFRSVWWKFVSFPSSFMFHPYWFRSANATTHHRPFFCRWHIWKTRWSRSKALESRWFSHGFPLWFWWPTGSEG